MVRNWHASTWQPKPNSSGTPNACSQLEAGTQVPGSQNQTALAHQVLAVSFKLAHEHLTAKTYLALAHQALAVSFIQILVFYVVWCGYPRHSCDNECNGLTRIEE